MISLRDLVIAVITVGASSALAETTSYGSFQHNSDLPSVLFLMSEIQDRDSFELRRAMRDQSIDLVVTASPGGSLYEGLQIAAILHDNNVGTYVPMGASCESACATVFLGGQHRLVIGELGVHQFYSGGPDADGAVRKDIATAATQYTTADIIGIMNEFDTPPFVYEKMFGTTDIYYFKAAEKQLLNRSEADIAGSDRVAEVDAYLSTNPKVLDRLPNLTDPAPAEAPAAATPPNLPPLPTMEEASAILLASVNADWSLPNDQALPRLATYYAPFVDFYGNPFTHAEVMTEKEDFASRWPVRSYRVEPGSFKVKCSSEGCVVDAVIAWLAASPARGAKASGRSTWSLWLTDIDGSLKIVRENGATLERN
ncbi:hypothetical protein [Rhodobacter sp. SY28-1]|uniref:hypothetical protein n=1 Tax=Rhodobacter sp. SY28-1 TaxID=2562317 RepID=UPI0010C0512F|nr:hypothetical protein [Rhodobacter sp. SY28-1]